MMRRFKGRVAKIVSSAPFAYCLTATSALGGAIGAIVLGHVIGPVIALLVLISAGFVTHQFAYSNGLEGLFPAIFLGVLGYALLSFTKWGLALPGIWAGTNVTLIIMPRLENAVLKKPTRQASDEPEDNAK